MDVAGEPLEAAGVEVTRIPLDVSSSKQCHAAVEAAAEFGGGRLEVIVHRAGTSLERAVLETSEADRARMIDVDLSGAFYCCHAADRKMKAA